MNLFLRLALMCFVFVSAAVGLFFSRSADAVPVFARKYQTACQTCHWATFPALNSFGRAFRDNGYTFPSDDEVYVKDTPVAMGGESWKKLFPKALWPSDIPHLPPLSVLVTSDFNYTPQISDGETSFNGIGEVELLTAGTLGESLSWFGAMALFENPGPTQASGTLVERLFGVYTPTLFGKKGLVNIEFGMFEPRATPRSEHLSIIGTAQYLFNTWPTLPTGNFTTFSVNQKGLELFGGKNGPKGKGGFLWAVGILNGEPQHEVMESWEGNTENYGEDIVVNVEDKWRGADNAFDMNNSKDYYGRLSYKIGGMGVMGGGTTDESAKDTENWQDNSLTLSGFFYRGNTGFFNDPVAATGWHTSGNRFWRYGTEFDFYWWNFNLFGAATFFRDDTRSDVTIDGVSGSNFDADLYTAELRWVALPWIIPAARFENMNPGYDAGDLDSFNRYSADINVILRANIKLLVGAAFADGEAPQMSLFDDTYRLGIQIAF
ncbi:MAG: hypothetical protein FJ266_05495 [Planctomycetes bacterium]|nr:hypothetical protein [Planctomycetota bacterium]